LPALGVHDDFQLTAHSVVDGNPLLQGMLLAEAVENADALAGFEVFGFVSHLEAIELLQDGDWEGHLVVLEIGEGTVVVQQHAGVEHENLGGHLG